MEGRSGAGHRRIVCPRHSYNACMLTSAEFGRSLCALLTGSLPAGVSLSAHDARVDVVTPGGEVYSTALGDLDAPDTEPDDYADAAWNVLSLVQDVVCEATGRSWPGEAENVDDVPDVGAQVTGDLLHCWYGDEAQPVLRLAPMRLMPGR